MHIYLGFCFLLWEHHPASMSPEYSLKPVITGIEDFYFVDVVSGADSLVMRVNFQDGDGDLGLSAREEDLFGEFILPLPRDENGELIKFDHTKDILNCNKFAFPSRIIGTDTITDTVRADRKPYGKKF